MKPLALIALLPTAVLSTESPDTLSTQHIQVHAVRLAEPIILDGILAEGVWRSPDAVVTFYQREPDEGKPASERTEVRVAYDDDAIYVGARMFDGSPDSIIARLGRRDAQTNSDELDLFIDPYHDYRDGFYFGVNAAGTLLDGVLYNDEWSDNSWDGVWEGKAHIDDQGWTVEMRIPFSQLRFKNQSVYTWGINFERDIGRRNERSFVVFTPKNGSGFVSRFPDLVGIEQIEPPHRLEILPYLTTRAEYTDHSVGDPFNSGSKYIPGTGADLKIGLGGNLTLDGTINPDFGQVEVDPAVVNLSDAETFFQEKRPFFIEGATTFEFGHGGSNNFWSFNWWEPTLFYSRRIGRVPQGELPSYDYADVPIGTHILGAAKLTGKVADSWNIGAIQALTRREFADLQSSGVRSRQEVEPLAYYGVARAQRDLNDGRQGVGVLTTLALQNFSDQSLRDQINSSALVTGLDGWTFLDSDKTYVLTGWTALSRVAGNQTQMIALQESSRHYFQRPDATEVHIDSAATSLTGYAGRFMVNKQKGDVMFNAAFGFISPKFDPNDLGFLSRTNLINGHITAGYRWTTPTEYYRSLRFNAATFASFDYGGNKTWHGYWFSGDVQFLNFYELWFAYAYNPQTVSDRRTRGGPLTINPVGREYDVSLDTDSRKSWIGHFFGTTYLGGGSTSYYLEASAQWKPIPNLSLSFGPNFSKDYTDAQWVDVFPDPTATATFGNRYVFAHIHQTTLAANIRLDWTFSPQLSLQVFMQPLISSVHYYDFKELARPKSYDFNVYGRGSSTISKVQDADGSSSYVVDPDGSGPAAPFSFSNPDFNLKSLRGNIVLRWEFRPGSTIYLVWTQNGSDSENLGDFQFGHSLSRLVALHLDNIFLVKFSYWWNV
jgi:hypothetical protein